MKRKLFRVGTKVKTTDRGAQTHRRAPEKPEGVGVIRDHYRSMSGTREPPYLVEIDGGSYWYDADEVERVGKSR